MDSEETYCEIEYLKEDIFFVKAKRIEIDGKPYVIKIKQEVDEKILQALLESDQIPERLAYYNEKIYHDSLTGAYNRRFFQEKMISVSKNTGIAMIDLDNFKAYNDTYGHHAGDLVLQTTVMTIKSVIRRDDILIRYGGDEFLLLMPGMQSQVFPIFRHFRLINELMYLKQLLMKNLRLHSRHKQQEFIAAITNQNIMRCYGCRRGSVMKKVPGWKKIEIVCVIIVVAFMSFLIGIYYQSRTERGSIRSLCSGWYQMKDGKRIELELPCSVTADAEGKVILYNDTLTEDDRGLIVSTRGIQDNLEIRTGERILYHYADNQFQKNKQMKGKMWADVRLPEEMGQEPLCFIYEGTAGRSLDIQVPILGSFSAIIVRHLQASAFSILMIISMLGLGIVAVSIFLYTRHRQLVEKRFVNVAVFLIICSLWCILDSGIYQMYGKHSAAGSLVSFYAFMLMSVPMLHFIQNTVSKENQWIPEIWILLFYGNAIGQGIVNIWFAVPFKNMLFVTHLILFTGVAAMAILLWREYQKHQTQELELCLKAFGVLGISGVIALALYWMYAIYWYDALFQFGILLFISFLFWGLLCKVSNDIQYRMEQAVYERMSIEDRMTGMKNRKAFEQQLDQLDRKSVV